MQTVEYVDRDSILHRLDPRVNILLSISLFAAAFAFTSPAFLFITFLFVVVLAVIGKVHTEFIPWLTFLIPVAVMAAIMWMLFSTASLSAIDSKVVATVGLLQITEYGFIMGLAMPFRVLTMITVPLLFMMTVSNEDLIKSLIALKVPYKIAFGFGLTLRLVYVFQEEIRTIRQAQKSRGAILDQGNPIKRIKRNLPVVIPAIVRGIETSDQLSTNLDLKGFSDTSERTSISTLEADRTDVTVAALCFIFLGGALTLRLLGYGTINL